MRVGHGPSGRPHRAASVLRGLRDFGGPRGIITRLTENPFLTAERDFCDPFGLTEIYKGYQRNTAEYAKITFLNVFTKAGYGRGVFTK